MSHIDWLPQLVGSDPLERTSALDGIAEQNDEEIVAASAAFLLADDDPGVREHAARLLERLDSEMAATRVIPHIASSDICVRNLAGEVLTRLGRHAVAALAPLINDRDKDVRKFTIDLLGTLPAQNLIDEIAERLDDKDPNVVLSVVETLSALGAAKYIDKLCDLYQREPYARPTVVSALSVFSEPAARYLVERALFEDDPVLQLTAAEGLATCGSPETLDLLVREIDHVDVVTRPVVMRSIIHLRNAYPEHQNCFPESFKEDLLRLLDDGDVSFWIAAVRGLGQYLDEVVIDALLRRTGSNDRFDLILFETIANYPGVMHRVLELNKSGQLPQSVAVGFGLGLMARRLLNDREEVEFADFLHLRFTTLDVETKLTILNVCQRMKGKMMDEIIESGRGDNDPMVRAFAQDVITKMGLVA